MKTKTITLQFPLEGENPVTEVTMRRIKVKDLRRVEAVRDGGSNFDASIQMLAVCTGLEVEQIEEIDAVDFETLSEELTSFLPKGST